LAPSSFVRGTRNADPAPSNYSQASEPNSIRKDISGRLTEFKGRPISYIDGQPCTRRSDGLWERIWFPDGPPKWKKAPDLSDDAYDEKTVAQYKYWKETGTFKDGIMPELPPKREWCSWDF
jgi:nucleoporin NUP42